MKDWKEFNDMKNEGWKAKTQEEYTKWQTEIKEWYKCQTELSEWDKDQIKAQLQKINENKKEYFKKQQNKKQFMPQPKVSYIFQDNLADALAEYIKVRTKLLEERLQKMY